ncbi:ARSK Arylsulfatase, partial [Atractosteus spatula]|nr:ARSK Arylsulfatase [Atractosteus spatula]
NRLGFLEGRLSNQEHSMAVLLEQAFRIKEDIIANLRASQGASVSEATSRRLLESHIHTITHIVKQLSKDIEVLEGQILQRDSVSSGTSFAVQSLDHKNLAGIGDLRGRVARCDASIAKLSGDVTAAGQEVHRLQKEILDVRAALDLRLKEMELKVTQVLEKVENSLAEQSSRMTATRGDQHHEIQLLELKTSGTLAELRGLMERHREWAEQQLSGSERAWAHGAEQLRALLRDRLEESEKKLGEQVSGLALRLEKAQEQQELEVRANREKRAEDRLNTRIGKLEDGRLTFEPGNKTVLLPYISYMREQGAVFLNSYTNSPICCPSRAAMWSGRFVHLTESWNNYKCLEENYTTWMDLLQKRGYYTKKLGKLDYRSGGHTVSNRVEAWTRDVDFLLRQEGRPVTNLTGDASTVRVMTEDWNTTDSASRWIRRSAAALAQPFALYVGLNLPHPYLTASLGSTAGGSTFRTSEFWLKKARG